MTKKEAIAKHRKLWTWIADSTKAKKKCVWKSQYFKYINENPTSYCYCCEYVKEHSNNCKDCPVIWGGSKKEKCAENEHKKWIKAVCNGDWQKAEKYARIIANLPERK